MHNLVNMGMKASHVWFCMLLILMCSVSYSSGQGCTYRVEVRTGDLRRAGTTATVSLDLCSGPNLCFFHTANLASFGTAGPSYNYFQRGNHDFFEIRTNQQCQKVCRIIIGHNNAGSSGRWYLDYVNVRTFDGGVLKSKDYFRVYQWLSLGTTLRADLNNCAVKAAAAQLASVLPLQYDFA